MKAGTSIEMSDGTKISVSTPSVVITPLIHSMMVVTSPMGEKAPPELAAITTSAAYISRSPRLCTSFLSTMIITILVVRLSKMAERKKVIKAILHISLRLERVFRASRTKLKPPFESTISTIVIAPIRKNSVPAASPR